LAIAVGALAVWFSAPQASAHAAYESSSPGFAEELAESPTVVSVRFTQELFRREGANRLWLSWTRTFDAWEVELTPVEISNDDRHVMRASLEIELEPGRYYLRWNNLSAEDGDTDSGSIPFYVATTPMTFEIDRDRVRAQELLIAYPGDEVDEPEAAETTAPSTPAVVRSDQDEDASLGAGPVIWLVVGALAAVIVVGALGFHFGSRRQGVP
jgi:methionine-rich copper-binding protein CopC